MIAIVNNNAVVINNSTSRRANVIAKRTNSDVMGDVKAQMIDVLKAKLQSGIAHFLFLKKDGSLREAWGPSFPLALLKQKRVPNFFGTLPAGAYGIIILGCVSIPYH